MFEPHSFSSPLSDECLMGPCPTTVSSNHPCHWDRAGAERAGISISREAVSLYHCHPIVHRFTRAGTSNISLTLNPEILAASPYSSFPMIGGSFRVRGMRPIVTVFGISNRPWVACQALPCGQDTLGSLPGSPRGMCLYV